MSCDRKLFASLAKKRASSKNNSVNLIQNISPNSSQESKNSGFSESELILPFEDISCLSQKSESLLPLQSSQNGTFLSKFPKNKSKSPKKLNKVGKKQVKSPKKSPKKINQRQRALNYGEQLKKEEYDANIKNKNLFAMMAKQSKVYKNGNCERILKNEENGVGKGTEAVITPSSYNEKTEESSINTEKFEKKSVFAAPSIVPGNCIGKRKRVICPGNNSGDVESDKSVKEEMITLRNNKQISSKVDSKPINNVFKQPYSTTSLPTKNKSSRFFSKPRKSKRKINLEAYSWKNDLEFSNDEKDNIKSTSHSQPVQPTNSEDFLTESNKNSHSQPTSVQNYEFDDLSNPQKKLSKKYPQLLELGNEKIFKDDLEYMFENDANINDGMLSMAERLDSDSRFYQYIQNSPSLLEDLSIKYFLPAFDACFKNPAGFAILCQSTAILFYTLTASVYVTCNSKEDEILFNTLINSNKKHDCHHFRYSNNFEQCFCCESPIIFPTNNFSKILKFFIQVFNNSSNIDKKLNIKNVKIFGKNVNKNYKNLMFDILNSIMLAMPQNLEEDDFDDKDQNNEKTFQSKTELLQKELISYFPILADSLWEYLYLAKLAPDTKCGKLNEIRILNLLMHFSKFSKFFEPLKSNKSRITLELYFDENSEGLKEQNTKNNLRRSARSKNNTTEAILKYNTETLEKILLKTLSVFVADNEFAATKLGNITGLLDIIFHQLIQAENYSNQVLIFSLAAGIIDLSATNRMYLEKKEENSDLNYKSVVDYCINFYEQNEKLVKKYEKNLGHDDQNETIPEQNDSFEIELNADEKKMNENDKNQMKRVLTRAEIHMRANVLAAHAALFLGCCIRHRDFSNILNKMKEKKLDFLFMSIILNKFLDFLKLMQGITERGIKVIENIIGVYEKLGGDVS